MGPGAQLGLGMMSGGNGSVWMTGERRGGGRKMDGERTEQRGAEQEQEGVLLDHYRWHIHSWDRGGERYGCEPDTETGLN